MRNARMFLIALLCLPSLSSAIFAQDLEPIRWTLKKTGSGTVSAGDKINVQAIATIEEGWHLYSPEQPVGGPIPTRITVTKGPVFRPSGEIEGPPPQVVFDPNFNMETEFFENEAVFVLPIEVSKDAQNGKAVLSVNTFFQTCNGRTCLPPKAVTVSIEFEVIGKAQNSSDSSMAVQPPSTQGTTKSSNGILSKSIDFDFIDFSGRPRKFSEYRGKYVLLDFWATWCAPCLADIPKLKEIYKRYRDSGFEIIGMDSETIGFEADTADPKFAEEASKRARQIVSTRGVIWTQVTSNTAVPIAENVFGIKALPAKILIDRDGNIFAMISEKDDLVFMLEKLISRNK